jgi:hypothetical protein
MSNPLDDFLGEYGEKTAVDWDKAGKSIAEHGGNALVGAAAVGAGTAMLGGVGMAAQHIYNAATAKRDFRGMMQWNEDLAHEDQRMVTQSFRTLRRFAPDMSKDPLVAGSVIRQMVQAPQGASGIMQQALQGQKNIGSPVMDNYMQAVQKSMVKGMESTPFSAEQKPGFPRPPQHFQQAQEPRYARPPQHSQQAQESRYAKPPQHQQPQPQQPNYKRPPQHQQKP